MVFGHFFVSRFSLCCISATTLYSAGLRRIFAAASLILDFERSFLGYRRPLFSCGKIGCFFPPRPSSGAFGYYGIAVHGSLTPTPLHPDFWTPQVQLMHSRSFLGYLFFITFDFLLVTCNFFVRSYSRLTDLPTTFKIRLYPYTSGANTI